MREYLTSDTSCPTQKIAELPMGMFTVCVWEMTNCTTTPPSYAGMMYADCAGAASQCIDGACSALNPPAIEPSPPRSLVDEFIATSIPAPQNSGNSNTSELIAAMALRTKIVRSNRKANPVTPSEPAKVIPATAGDIMPNWGRNGWEAKYLKCVRVRTTLDSSQYFALYKLFRRDENNSGGDVDLETDKYVGIRLTTGPALPVPGGMSVVPMNSANFQALDKNETDAIVEVAVRVPVPQKGPSGTPGNPKKWFHLYGASF